MNSGNSTYHEHGGWRSFGEALLYESIQEYNLRQLDSEIILGGSSILSDRGTYTNRRNRDVLPNEFLWPAKRGLEAKQLAILSGM
jgi:hypothetical protein